MKKISFIVYYPYQWFIYKNIYNKISPDKREVIIDLGFQPLLQDKEVEETIKKILDEHKVTYRILRRHDFYRIQYLEEFFTSVEVMVSCWESSCMAVDETAHIKKVCVTYGIAKELTMIRPSRSVYDVILAYGKRDAALFSLMTKAIAIGNPRVDNFYLNKPHETTAAKNIIAFKKPGKKTVLYVPTHGDLGSLSVMRSAIESLAETYAFIVKPHYYTLREERELVESYKQIKGVLVVDDSYDTIETMALSEVVLSDNSSAIFDAMQVRKPIVVCDFVSKQYLDDNHKNLRLSKRGVVGATTYSKSLEQEVKENNQVVKISTPKELGDTLAKVDELQSVHAGVQQSLVVEHFAYTDGHSSDRAVAAIEEIYEKERNYTPGILHHGYLSFNNRIIRTMLAQKVESVKMDQVAKNVYVWILCEADTQAEDLLTTVYSALENSCVTKVYVTNSSASKFADELMGEERVIFTSSDEVFRHLYHTFETAADVLIARPSTILKNVGVAVSLKDINDKEILFFAENTFNRNADATSRLFSLLKKEILNNDSEWRDLLLDVTLNQIKSIEKSAILVSVKKVREHDGYAFPVVSFEQLSAFLIELYLFRAMPFFLLPNFFMGLVYIRPHELSVKLLKRAAYLEIDNIPVREWADFKPGKYLWEIMKGNLEYVSLLRLLVMKSSTYYKHRQNRAKSIVKS